MNWKVKTEETQSVSDAQPNYLALALACIMVVSVFLPWVSASSQSPAMGVTSKFSSGGNPGIDLDLGILALILAVFGGIYAIQGKPWSSISGVINLLIGIPILFGWQKTFGGFSSNSHFAVVSVVGRTKPEVGLYVFCGAAILFTLVSLQGTTTNQTRSRNRRSPRVRG